jgi:pyrroline-5-carboxylate reductase
LRFYTNILETFLNKVQMKIAIIGGGNLGSSIAKGLVNSGFLAQNLLVTRRRADLLQSLSELGIQTGSDNALAVLQAQIVIVAVKPYKTKDIFKELREYLTENQIIVSVISGISIEQILKYLKKDLTVYRVVPNTAIAIKESMTCVASYNATPEQDQQIKQIFDVLGQTLFMSEELMDASTVLAACGIAYVMRFVRAMVQGGIEIGFSSQMASLIANQTVKGAAELLIKNGLHPEQEIDKVTTPKGYTIAGLNEMEHNGFSSSLIKGILTSFNKIELNTK